MSTYPYCELRRCLYHLCRVDAAIIVGKLETCLPRWAGQGVSDPARAWNTSRDKIDRRDR